MEKRVIIDSQLLNIIIDRLCQQLIENHHDFNQSVILGLYPRGVFLADRIQQRLYKLIDINVPVGKLDISFHRDDFRRREVVAESYSMNVPFSIENKKVILIDDVLYTGRTIRSAMEAMLGFGRPSKVELLTLIDRKYSRDLPIEADYIGKYVSTVQTERVWVDFNEQGTGIEDKVWIIKKNSDK